MQLGKHLRKQSKVTREANARATYLRNPSDRSALEFALELNPNNGEARHLLNELNAKW